MLPFLWMPPFGQLVSVLLHHGRAALWYYTACMGVPQYLCHRSMALVTMASVFSCGIWGAKPVWAVTLYPYDNVCAVYSRCTVIQARLQAGSCPSTRSCSWGGFPRPRTRGSYRSRWSLCPTLWEERVNTKAINTTKNSQSCKMFTGIKTQLESLSWTVLKWYLPIKTSGIEKVSSMSDWILSEFYFLTKLR